MNKLSPFWPLLAPKELLIPLQRKADFFAERAFWEQIRAGENASLPGQLLPLNCHLIRHLWIFKHQGNQP